MTEIWASKLAPLLQLRLKCNQIEQLRVLDYNYRLCIPPPSSTTAYTSAKLVPCLASVVVGHHHLVQGRACACVRKWLAVAHCAPHWAKDPEHHTRGQRLGVDDRVSRAWGATALTRGNDCRALFAASRPRHGLRCVGLDLLRSIETYHSPIEILLKQGKWPPRSRGDRNQVLGSGLSGFF